MKRAAVLIVAALLLAGCGSSAPARTQPEATLCIDAGLRRQIPVGGLRVGDDRVSICQVADDAAGDATILAHAVTAAQSRRTIAYVGGLSGAQAQVTDAVLRSAGIALLSPGGPAPGATLTPANAGGSPSPPSTVLSLMPSAQAQADAVSAQRTVRGCGTRRRGRLRCSVFAADAAPLCTGITAVVAVTARTPPRYCVVAGSDLANWPSPAVAYGATIGRLLMRGLRGIAGAGGDLENRISVLAKLRQADERQSPIGPLRFNAQGGIAADLFAAYTVEADGRLVLSRMFRTH